MELKFVGADKSLVFRTRFVEYAATPEFVILETARCCSGVSVFEIAALDVFSFLPQPAIRHIAKKRPNSFKPAPVLVEIVKKGRM